MMDNLNIIRNEIEEVKKINESDSKWSHNRRIIVACIIILTLLSYIGVKIYNSMRVLPSCADNIMNGDEQGVDCGGVCNLMCINEYKPLSIMYSNYFANADGTYDLLTLVENDSNSGAPRELSIKYEVYDNYGARGEDINVTLPSASGNIIPIIVNNQKTSVLVSKINTKINGYKMYKNNTRYNLRLKDFEFEKGSTSKLRVDFESLNKADKRMQILVLLKDNLGNIINFGTQSIDALAAGGNYTLYYTFSEEIKGEVATVTLVPVYN